MTQHSLGERIKKSHLPSLEDSQQHSAQQSPCYDPSFRYAADAFPRDNTAETRVSKAVSKQPFSINGSLDTGPECLHYLYISNLVFCAHSTTTVISGRALFVSCRGFFKSGITTACLKCL